MPSTAASSNGRNLTTASAKAGSAVLTYCATKAKAFVQRLQPCPPILVPLLILLVATVLLCFSGWEIGISALFHDGDKTWTLKDAQPWAAIYDLGVVPALVLGGTGLAVAIVALLVPALTTWRKHGFLASLRSLRVNCSSRIRENSDQSGDERSCPTAATTPEVTARHKATIRAGLFLGLALALGPGLVVNGFLKPCWNRPRPNQLAVFGGSAEYSPAWWPGGEPTGKSFASGHASMGFFLMVPGFLLYRRRRRLAVLVFGVGLAAGGVVGLARIVQGGHFVSDVLWSAACVYFSAFALYLLFRFDIANEAQAKPDRRGETVLHLPDDAATDEYRDAA